MELILKDAKVAVLLNTASGSYAPDADEKIEAILTEHGMHARRTWTADPDQIEAAFKEIVAYAPDILIVLGGDGTIRCGAETCLGSETLLVPLPGGTMNMLPKALYGTRSWEEALRATLEHPRVIPVSGGEATGKQFFIAAVIGNPTLWTHAREALRTGDIRAAIEKGMHAFQNMLATKMSYTFSEEAAGEADALAIICPLISESLHNEEKWLEAAVIDVNDAAGVLELASSAAFGTWRDSEKVSIVKTRSVTIRADEDIPIILDGESMELGKDIEITFVPRAFRALVPGE